MHPDAELDNTGQRFLGEALAGTTKLRELQLFVSVPASETLKDFSRGLRANTTLHKLEIRSAGLAKVDMHDPSLLFEALEVNDTVRELKLSVRAVETDPGVAGAMLSMLQKNRSINSLEMPFVLSASTEHDRRVAEAVRSRQGLLRVCLTMPRP